MSEPITQNEMQHMLDRTVERIKNEIGDRLAMIETQINHLNQDSLRRYDEIARFIQAPTSANNQNNPDTTFRM